MCYSQYFKKLEETKSWETQKSPVRPSKTDRLVSNESKKDRFATATAISKRANANLGIKISRHTISRRPKKINLNSRILTFLKRTKWAVWNLPQNTSYGLKNNGILFILAVSQNLTYSVVILRKDISLSALKASFNLEEEVWWCLVWFQLLVQDLLWDNTVKEIWKKRVVSNLRTTINQPAICMQDNAPRHIAKSVKTLLSEEDLTAMEWPTQSPDINLINNVWKFLNERAKKRIQETSKNNRLIWKENGRKYPLMNARH